MLRLNIPQLLGYFQEYLDYNNSYIRVCKSGRHTQERKIEACRYMEKAYRAVVALCDVLNLDMDKCLSLTRAYLTWGNRTEWQRLIDYDMERNYDSYLRYILNPDSTDTGDGHMELMHRVISDWAKRSMANKKGREAI